MDPTSVRTDVLNGRLLRVIPSAMFIALTALAIPLVQNVRSIDDRTSARDAAIVAARAEVSDLVNISFHSAQHDLDRIVAGATGHLAELFAAQRSQLDLLIQSKSVTTGTVLSAGLIRLDLALGVARVDVAADATVADAQHTRPLMKHYRWILTLQRRHGRWLVSDAALAGVPQ